MNLKLAVLVAAALLPNVACGTSTSAESRSSTSGRRLLSMPAEPETMPAGTARFCVGRLNYILSGNEQMPPVLVEGTGSNAYIPSMSSMELVDETDPNSDLLVGLNTRIIRVNASCHASLIAEWGANGMSRGPGHLVFLAVAGLAVLDLESRSVTALPYPQPYAGGYDSGEARSVVYVPQRNKVYYVRNWYTLDSVERRPELWESNPDGTGARNVTAVASELERYWRPSLDGLAVDPFDSGKLYTTLGGFIYVIDIDTGSSTVFSKLREPGVDSVAILANSTTGYWRLFVAASSNIVAFNRSGVEMREEAIPPPPTSGATGPAYGLAASSHQSVLYAEYGRLVVYAHKVPYSLVTSSVASNSTSSSTPVSNNSSNSVSGSCAPTHPGYAFTARYEIVCPPNVTLAGVEAVDVAGVSGKVCGARMPDLRYLIPGDYSSDSGITLAQQPVPGAFIAPRFSGTPDGPWTTFSVLNQTSAPVRVTMSVSNPTTAGPFGSCSFDVTLPDPAGPPLCPGTCPPRLALLRKPPGNCTLALPSVLQSMTLREPPCLRPHAATLDKYETVPTAPAAMDLSSAWPWSLDVVVRHRDYPQGSSCPVRFAVYREEPPAFAPSNAPAATVTALNVTVFAAATTADREFRLTYSASLQDACAPTARFCRPVVRAELSGGRPSDVATDGNFTFARAVPAWRHGAFGELFVSRLASDALLACPDAPSLPVGASRVLRRYRLFLSCTFNAGLPPPAKPIRASYLDPAWVVDLQAPACAPPAA